jgi:protein phosphatase
VGDSRIYLAAENYMEQLTDDHSCLTSEMVAQGLICEEKAKKYPKTVLTRAIGTDVDVSIDKGSVPLDGLRQILICSDGLTNMLSDKEIFDIMKSDISKEQAADALVKSAIAAGGLDNISVIVIGWGE